MSGVKIHIYEGTAKEFYIFMASFLMILTGTTRYAIRREDGVYVVPVGCLVISRLFW